MFARTDGQTDVKRMSFGSVPSSVPFRVLLTTDHLGVECNIETCWAKRILNKLNMLGLGYLWNNANISLKDFPIIIQRIRYVYIVNVKNDSHSLS